MRITTYNNDASFSTFCFKHGIEVEIHAPDPTLAMLFTASIKGSQPFQSARGATQIGALHNLVDCLCGKSFSVPANGEMKEIHVGNLWLPSNILCTETVVLKY